MLPGLGQGKSLAFRIAGESDVIIIAHIYNTILFSLMVSPEIKTQRFGGKHGGKEL